jgi:hypothetical protein
MPAAAHVPADPGDSREGETGLHRGGRQELLQAYRCRSRRVSPVLRCGSSRTRLGTGVRKAPRRLPSRSRRTSCLTNEESPLTARSRKRSCRCGSSRPTPRTRSSSSMSTRSISDFGAYGVAAASLIYFDKSVHELELEELAYLAALPKGPSNYHPYRQTEAAIARRNYVIDRMVADGYVTGRGRRGSQGEADQGHTARNRNAPACGRILHRRGPP